MKSIFRSNRHKDPHQNEAENKEGAFFSKESKKPFFDNTKPPAVQTKLTIGEPGDKYEKEADSMADAVVNNATTTKPDIQHKEISTIQRVSLATPIEDEKLGTAEQRMEKDKLIQEKLEIQKMEAPEEEIVQQMEGEEEEGIINKMDEEEEETVQTKSNGVANNAGSNLSQQITSKTGKGKNLPKNTQAEMESSFNTDFSDVNIHTDSEAIKMNKELGAQAFTHGKDVYFNSGKFNPEATEGKRLLAHELTHVVQQGGISKRIQRQRLRRRRSSRQQAYRVRDSELGGGGTLVEDLADLKRLLMYTRNTNEWTLVLAIHGSENRVAAQEPNQDTPESEEKWQHNAIFYYSNNINALFSDDPRWVRWRDRFGPTHLSLVSCQVSQALENTLINNFTRQNNGGQSQSAIGLGRGCSPHTFLPEFPVYARTRQEYDSWDSSYQNRLLNQLRSLNRIYGYNGSPPVPESQILDYFFNEEPVANWPKVEVVHSGTGDRFPFWRRGLGMGDDARRFRQLCDRGIGRLGGRNSIRPPSPTN